MWFKLFHVLCDDSVKNESCGQNLVLNSGLYTNLVRRVLISSISFETSQDGRKIAGCFFGLGISSERCSKFTLSFVHSCEKSAVTWTFALGVDAMLL